MLNFKFCKISFRSDDGRSVVHDLLPTSNCWSATKRCGTLPQLQIASWFRVERDAALSLLLEPYKYALLMNLLSYSSHGVFDGTPAAEYIIPIALASSPAFWLSMNFLLLNVRYIGSKLLAGICSQTAGIKPSHLSFINCSPVSPYRNAM